MTDFEDLLKLSVAVLTTAQNAAEAVEATLTSIYQSHPPEAAWRADGAGIRVDRARYQPASTA